MPKSSEAKSDPPPAFFRATLFRKQLAILLLVTLAFAAVAMYVSDLAVRAMITWSSKDDATGGPTQGFVRLIAELTNDGRLTIDEAVEKINRAAPSRRVQVISVVDTKTIHEKFEIEDAMVPADPFQAYTVREKELRFPRLIVFRAKNAPGRFLVFERGERMAGEMPGGMPGGGPPPGPLSDMDGGPGGPKMRGGPPPGFPPGPGGPGGGPGGPGGPPPIFVWTFGALVLSGFLAAAISLFLLFSSMRRKAREAADVITAIKQGDWQKRMSIDSVDEVGHLMQEFNRMADEIESAVRSMQRAEASRTSLLQELAHDLRTPVASLRGLIETLEMRNESLNAKARGELFSLAQKEIDYFARLVEDLLFLAQVRDPRYLNSGKPVDFAEIVREQVDRADQGKIDVHLNGLTEDTSLLLRGDEVLLKRLVRNAIDNAASFAKSEIDITVENVADPKSYRLTIRDNGPGFSEQALATFGEKRFSRFIGTNDGERLSVGLGSVIMSTVADVHGGSVVAKNRSDGQTGAEVSIVLPIA